MMTIAPNYVHDFGDWYISVNHVDHWHYGGPSTAIVIGQMEVFYVMKGDHDKELAGRCLGEAMHYFMTHGECFFDIT